MGENLVTTLVWLAKISLFWVLAGPLVGFSFRRWQRRWSFEWFLAVVFVLLQFSGMLFFGALDYLPKFGKWFRLFPGVLIHFDPTQPLGSLAGLLIVYGSIIFVSAAIFLIVFTRMFHVPQNSLWTRIAFWIFTLSLLTEIQDWIFRRWGISDPHETDFAVLWSVLARRATVLDPKAWRGPLEAGGFFLLLCSLSLIFHLFWKATRDITPDQTDRSTNRRRTRIFLVALNLLFTMTWWHLGVRLVALWKPQLAEPLVTPSPIWVAWYGGTFLLVMGVVASSALVDSQHLSLDAPHGDRVSIILATLLWSIMAAAGVAALGMHTGHWTSMMVHAIPSPMLLRYTAIILAQSLAASLLLQGYTLHATASLYGYGPALFLSALGYCLIFGHTGMSRGEGLLLLLLGLFLGLLYLFTQALWAPVSFQLGWWLVLGPILGFPVAPLKAPAWGSKWVTGTVSSSAGIHVDSVSGMVLVIVLSTALLMFLNPSRHTAPIRHAD